MNTPTRDTPDFILAQFLIGCLAAYDQAVTAREKYYGRGPVPSEVGLPPPDGYVAHVPHAAAIAGLAVFDKLEEIEQGVFSTLEPPLETKMHAIVAKFARLADTSPCPWLTKLRNAGRVIDFQSRVLDLDVMLGHIEILAERRGGESGTAKAPIDVMSGDAPISLIEVQLTLSGRARYVSGGINGLVAWSLWCITGSDTHFATVVRVPSLTDHELMMMDWSDFYFSGDIGDPMRHFIYVGIGQAPQGAPGQMIPPKPLPPEDGLTYVNTLLGVIDPHSPLPPAPLDFDAILNQIYKVRDDRRPFFPDETGIPVSPKPPHSADRTSA